MLFQRRYFCTSYDGCVQARAHHVVKSSGRCNACGAILVEAESALNRTLLKIVLPVAFILLLSSIFWNSFIPKPLSGYSFNEPEVIVLEREGIIELELKRNDGANAEILKYYTESISARSGVDYVEEVGEVKIDAGEVSVKIPITLLDDHIPNEPDRSFRVGLFRTAPSVYVTVVIQSDPTESRQVAAADILIREASRIILDLSGYKRKAGVLESLIASRKLSATEFSRYKRKLSDYNSSLRSSQARLYEILNDLKDYTSQQVEYAGNEWIETLLQRGNKPQSVATQFFLQHLSEFKELGDARMEPWINVYERHVAKEPLPNLM